MCFPDFLNLSVLLREPERQNMEPQNEQDNLSKQNRSRSEEEGEDDFYDNDHVEAGFLKKSFDSYLATKPANFEGYAWKLSIIIAVYAFFNDAVNWSLLSPVLFIIKKNWFGSDKAAGKWNGYIKGFSALGSVVLAVVLGHAADRMGRRPLMNLVAAFALITNSTLYVLYPNPVPYMIVAAVNGTLARVGWAAISAMLIDKYPIESHRVRALSVFIAARMAATLCNIVEAAVPGGTNPDPVVLVALVASAVGLVYSVHFIPETEPTTVAASVLPESDVEGHINERDPLMVATTKNTDDMEQLRMTKEEAGDVKIESNPLKTVVKILKNPLLLTLITSEAFSSAAWFGQGDILNYYFNHRIGWDSEDAAISDPIQNGVKVVGLLFVLPFLQKKLSAIGLIQLGNIFVLLYIINNAFVYDKFQVWIVGSFFGGMQVIRMPSLRSIIADESSLTERTIYQAVVQAVDDVASGLSGLLFGYVYSHMEPWVLFLICILLQVCACIAAACMWKFNKRSKK